VVSTNTENSAGRRVIYCRHVQLRSRERKLMRAAQLPVSAQPCEPWRIRRTSVRLIIKWCASASHVRRPTERPNTITHTHTLTTKTGVSLAYHFHRRYIGLRRHRNLPQGGGTVKGILPFGGKNCNIPAQMMLYVYQHVHVQQILNRGFRPVYVRFIIISQPVAQWLDYNRQ